MSKYNEHRGQDDKTTIESVNTYGFNRMSGVIVAGTYGGAGGGGGTEYARGGKGGAGGDSEVVTFHNVDITNLNTITIEVGNRGNAGPKGNGNNQGNAGTGGLSNFNQAEGKTHIYKNHSRTASNLMFTSQSGNRGLGGQGPNQGQEHGWTSASASGLDISPRTYSVALPGGSTPITSTPITVNIGKGGNGGDGGGYSGGQGENGQVGQVGYGLIFLQKG